MLFILYSKNSINQVEMNKGINHSYLLGHILF